MNHWKVKWVESAEADLGNIWFHDNQSERVNHASSEIDKKLAEDPRRHGVPLAEGLLVIEEHPLRVVFEIADQHRRIVRVLSLALLRD